MERRVAWWGQEEGNMEKRRRWPPCKIEALVPAYRLVNERICSLKTEGDGNPLQYSCLENPMEPGRLQSMRLQRVRHDCSTSLSL